MAGGGPGGAVVKVLLLPLYLVAGTVFLLVWALFTFTGIGPLIQYWRTRRDNTILSRCLKPSPSAVVELVTPLNIPLAIRWSPGKDPTLNPVCIPNGLGATLITIGKLHDELEAKGYPVLSYDRAGVGLSGPLPETYSRGYATAADVVAEMKAVMDACVPNGGRRPWILVGPSMGSIVAQCYIAVHPADVCGLLNMDGLPYPFAAKTPKFLKAGKVYDFVCSIVWTGVLRPFLAMAGSKLHDIVTPTFSIDVVRAQMNGRRFYQSLATEMKTMMDLASFALEAWGPAFNIPAYPPEKLAQLINAAPLGCGDWTPEKGWVDLPRAPVEVGDGWIPAAEARSKVAEWFKDAGSVPLVKAFPQLVVRVMSARNYVFGDPSEFYDKEMQNWSAAEHSLHALVAKDGGRYVFPSRNHANMFFTLTPFIANQVDAIAAVVLGRQPVGLPGPLSTSADQRV